MAKAAKVTLADVGRFPPHVQRQILQQLQAQGVNTNITQNGNVNQLRYQQQAHTQRAAIPTMIFIAICVLLLMTMFGLSGHHGSGNASTTSYKTSLIR